jgi:hypothetical protein
MKVTLYSADDAAQFLAISLHELAAWTDAGYIDAVVSKAGVCCYFSTALQSVDVGSIREEQERREAAELQASLEAKVANEHALAVRSAERQTRLERRLRMSTRGSAVAAALSVGVTIWMLLAPAMNWFEGLANLGLFAVVLPMAAIMSARETKENLDRSYSFVERLDWKLWTITALSAGVFVWVGMDKGNHAQDLPQSREVVAALRALPATPSFRDQTTLMQATCGASGAEALQQARELVIDPIAKQAESKVLQGVAYTDVQDAATEELTNTLSTVYATTLADCKAQQ